jgi:hypothetical protein
MTISIEQNIRGFLRVQSLIVLINLSVIHILLCLHLVAIDTLHINFQVFLSFHQWWIFTIQFPEFFQCLSYDMFPFHLILLNIALWFFTTLIFDVIVTIPKYCVSVELTVIRATPLNFPLPPWVPCYFTWPKKYFLQYSVKIHCYAPLKIPLRYRK